MPRRRFLLTSLATAIAAPAALLAQGTPKTLQIPAGYAPPPGMCRVWVDGVPANKQPAVTDCQKALRNIPANAQVVFGESKATGTSGRPSSNNAARQQLLVPGVATPLNPTRPAARPASPPARDTTKAKRDTVPPKKPVVPPPSA